MRLASCILLGLALCSCLWGAQKSRPAAAPANKPLIRDSIDDELPMTPPTAIENAQKVPREPSMPDGATVLNLPAQPARDATGKWWTVNEPRVGPVRLMPCELLDETLAVMRQQPDEKLLLSGELYAYKGSYYFLLRKTAFAPTPPPATRAATSEPLGGELVFDPKASDRGAVEPAPTSRPAAPSTGPTSSPVRSSDDVARAMLEQNPIKPVLPYQLTVIPKAAFKAVTSARQPLKAGPERIVATRIVRLHGPDAEGWYEAAFESDNTLQDPPMRLLPCALLERLEELNMRKGGFSRLYYISGEILQSGDHAYLLPREARAKLELNEF